MKKLVLLLPLSVLITGIQAMDPATEPLSLLAQAATGAGAVQAPAATLPAVETGSNAHKCYYARCGFETEWPHNLERHIVSKHIKCKVFCNVPGCSFPGTTDPSALKRHKKTHDRHATTYRCDFGSCAYATTRREHLQSHMRTHSDEKTLACTVAGCSYRAKEKTTLTRHMLVHEKSSKVPKMLNALCRICRQEILDIENHIQSHFTTPMTTSEASVPSLTHTTSISPITSALTLGTALFAPIPSVVAAAPSIAAATTTTTTTATTQP